MDSIRDLEQQRNDCRGNEQEDPVLEIAALISSNFAYVIALVNVFMKYLESTQNVENCRALLQTTNSKKRKLDENEEWLLSKVRGVRLKSYCLFFKEIFCGWYIKPRTVSWYLLFIDWVPSEDPERFREFFRVSPRTFYYLCELLHDDLITKPPASLCKLPNRKLDVKRQVAIALRRLASGDGYLGIAELFGLSTATIIKVTWKFIKALNSKGRGEISWPTGEAMTRIKAQFAQRGFPGCCGAIDGTHFPIELPAGEASEDYFDYKSKLSISMQGVCDQNLRFLDVVVGWPGSIQDTRLLRNSGFYRGVVYSKSRLNGHPHFCANGTELREYILGDAGYPLLDWLIVPYTRGIDQAHDDWNHTHSSVRMCIERAFGRLKGVWRILSRTLWKPRMERIGPMIYACCIMQNLMVRFGDLVSPKDCLPPRPPGYGPVSCPSREILAGGPEARAALFDEVIQRRQVRRITRPVQGL